MARQLKRADYFEYNAWELNQQANQMSQPSRHELPKRNEASGFADSVISQSMGQDNRTFCPIVEGRAPTTVTSEVDSANRMADSSAITFLTSRKDRDDAYRTLITGSLFNKALAQKLIVDEKEMEKVQKLADVSDNLSIVLSTDVIHKEENVEKDGAKPGATKYGWIRGVMMRCVLQIFSGMLFLRLSWVVGQGGLLSAVGIVLVASVVTTLSTFSMSAIATNGHVSGGGVYFLISRSLGPRFGGSIGLVYGIANAIAVAMHAAALAETVRDSHVMTSSAYDMMDKISWIRLIGTGVIIVALLCCSVGLLLESIVQIFMLIILTVSISICIIGPFIFTPDKQLRGYTNMSLATLSTNMLPPSPSTGPVTPFHELFAIFFPAATGVLAGANISGDLKDPGTAISKGTLLAILITSVVYIGMAALCAACVVQRQSIDLSRYFVNGRLMMELVPKILRQRVVDQLDSMGKAVADLPSTNITTALIGLAEDRQIYLELALNNYVVEAGIYAAAFSSALACLVSAPKILQAVIRDEMFTSNKYVVLLSKGYGPNNEPIWLYLASFGIAIASMQIGKLDIVAMVVSCLFLLNYCLVNMACFDASQSHSPGWRPGYRYYHKSLSLLGFFVCATCMFAVSWWGAASAIFIVFCCYMIVVYRDPGQQALFPCSLSPSAALALALTSSFLDINWGSSRQAIQYIDALKNLLRLRKVRDHVKNYRPQVLVLSGYLADRPGLIDLAHLITYDQSLLVCGTVKACDQNISNWHTNVKALQEYLKGRDVRGFYTSVYSNDFRQGCRALMQTSGLGNMRCNVVMVGFHRHWKHCSYSKVIDYYNVILDAFYLGFGVIIVCAKLNVRENVPGDVLDQVNRLLSTNSQTAAQIAEQVKSVAKMQLEQDVEQQGRLSRVLNSARRILRHKPKLFYSASLPLVLPWADPYDQRAVDRAAKHATTKRTRRGAATPDTSVSTSSDAQATGFSYLKMPVIEDADEKREGSQHKESKQDASASTTEKSEEKTTQPNENLALHRWLIDGLPKALEIANSFRRLQSGTVDVYWIYKDGGLGLLVPYLIHCRPLYKYCKLRVFSICYDHEDKKTQQKELQKTLTALRVPAADVRVLPCLTRQRLPDSEMLEFMESIKMLLKPDPPAEQSAGPSSAPDSSKPEPLTREFTREHLRKHRSRDISSTEKGHECITS